ARPGRGGSGVGLFFQAEDGIRDRNVTGVQTCALPICLFRDHVPQWFRARYRSLAQPMFRWWGFLMTNTRMIVLFLLLLAGRPVRSEERRVGKGCRSGWWPAPLRARRRSGR